jgi:hypothetical protein
VPDAMWLPSRRSARPRRCPRPAASPAIRIASPIRWSPAGSRRSPWPRRGWTGWPPTRQRSSSGRQRHLARRPAPTRASARWRSLPYPAHADATDTDESAAAMPSSRAPTAARGWCAGGAHGIRGRCSGERTRIDHSSGCGLATYRRLLSRPACSEQKRKYLCCLRAPLLRAAISKKGCVTYIE